MAVAPNLVSRECDGRRHQPPMAKRWFHWILPEPVPVVPLPVVPLPIGGRGKPIEVSDRA